MPISSIWNRDFPFFLACDGNLWKMMPISSIWKRDFRCFLGLWWEPLENNVNIFYLKTGFPSFFGLVTGTFRKYCQYLLFENGISVVFWSCDGDLWKIMSISSIWKWNFRVFFGLWVMVTSGKQCQYLLFENGISLFLGLWWDPLENNTNIFYLKTGFPWFFGLWWEPFENTANIFYLKTRFPLFFGLVIWASPIALTAKSSHFFLAKILVLLRRAETQLSIMCFRTVMFATMCAKLEIIYTPSLPPIHL